MQVRQDFGITYMPIAIKNLEHIKITSILWECINEKETFKNLLQEQCPYVIPAFPLSGLPTE